MNCIVWGQCGLQALKTATHKSHFPHTQLSAILQLRWKERAILNQIPHIVIEQFLLSVPAARFHSSLSISQQKSAGWHTTGYLAHSMSASYKLCFGMYFFIAFCRLYSLMPDFWGCGWADIFISSCKALVHAWTKKCCTRTFWTSKIWWRLCANPEYCSKDLIFCSMSSVNVMLMGPFVFN